MPTYIDALENAQALPFDPPNVCNEGLVVEDNQNALGITKGGDWLSAPASARPNNRVPQTINTRSDRIGFRVASPIGF